MLRSFGLGVTLYAFWLVLSGHYTPLLLGLGAASCGLAVYMAHRMNVVDREGLPFHIAFRFFLYFPWLLKEIFVSNVTMARIVLSPKLPIAPKLGRYRLPFRTDLGRVIYANSVTFTPGTVSVVVEPDAIEVHVLTGEGFGTGPDDGMIRRVQKVEGS